MLPPTSTLGNNPSHKENRLNVILREYRAGEKIDWHQDIPAFGPEIFGCILDRTTLAARLQFSPERPPQPNSTVYTVDEQ